MMLVPQRFSKCFPVLAALVLVIFLLTASRLHNGIPIPKSILDIGGERPLPKALGVVELQDSLPSSKEAGTPVAGQATPELGKCERPELRHLRRPQLGLTHSIVYTRRCIKPLRGRSDRDAVTNITLPLLTNKATINLAACPRVDLGPCDYISLQVPPPYPERQYRHLIFGVASTYDRVRESLPALAHWLSGTGAQLVAIVMDGDHLGANYNLTALEEEYRRWEVNATLLAPSMLKHTESLHGGDKGGGGGGEGENGSQQRKSIEQYHFLLVREMVAVATPETRWLGVMDDDTFFPSLYTLDAELAQHDHTRPAWLGAMSDDFSSIRVWGIMAFGGAGAFLSLPLAREIEPLSEQCIREALAPATGDGILRDCIYANTRTKLSLVRGLHQHDLRGDASGFYESGARPLSVHHWKSWYRAPLPQMAAATGVCGDCFLQRWRFGGDTLLANGYSIAQYGDGLADTLDFARIEGTWESPDSHDYDFSYGPLRPRLTHRQKKSYRLVDVSVVVTEGASGERNRRAFRQVYVYRGSDSMLADEEEEEAEGGYDGAAGVETSKEPAMDEVVELLWDI
ncbi:glycosyltransferase family 31 protein [Lasiosphaeria ovina]|uniref:Glycosyltransferase family 31 protein n=1 Tax=Lasiosphaeria ovina TaxID=92902 RepID=A0AAE0KJ84_9PEZI|nr:glycosyltransferase family 31 protein [Lasiosphaeria ovina]